MRNTPPSEREREIEMERETKSDDEKEPMDMREGIESHRLHFSRSSTRAVTGMKQRIVRYDERERKGNAETSSCLLLEHLLLSL